MSRSLGILIVDDEPLARDRLRRLLADIPDTQVLGEADQGDRAIAQVGALDPDVVLLDVRMPGMDGIEAARRIARLDNPPAIIFCTAYDEYALEAFRVSASDYLLKPVRQSALAEALQRAGRTNRLQRQSLEQPTGDVTPLVTQGLRGTELIDPAGISCCVADQKYVTIRHRDGETISDHTLKDLELRYPQHLLRIHRNALVNPAFVRALRRRGDSAVICLKDGSAELQVSRRHLADVRAHLTHLAELPDESG